ncbi:MAG: iron uptake porin [Okeania sp. SIO3H1]|nr:iron uptake porin [Okeania sp. SIO3H1]
MQILKIHGIDKKNNHRKICILISLILINLSCLSTRRSLATEEKQELMGEIQKYTEEFSNSKSNDPITQQIPVYQLNDILPSDWAYEALISLRDRYDCLSGYPDNTYRGNRPITRYEFAAAVNTCWQTIESFLAENQAELIQQDDLIVIEKLIQDFQVEIANLKARTEGLENRVDALEAQQFSTTTKLNGQTIFAVNAGGFDGDRLIDPNGIELADENPQATFLYRAVFDFDTSFRGTDLLKLRVDTGSNGFIDNATAILEPNFGSILDFSKRPPGDDEFGIGRAFYSFQVIENLSLSIGPLIEALDYIDNNSYADLSFRDFSTENLVYNYVAFPVNGVGGGAILEWNPGGSAFNLRALYIAPDSANPSQNGQGPLPVSVFTSLLYSDGRGSRGLFGFHQGMVEFEYNPSSRFSLRLLYSGGKVFARNFDAVGVNFEWGFSGKFAVFGRYGYSSYDDTDFGDINPNYWMAGLSGLDVLQEGDRLGVAVGQPFVVDEIGNSTQTNLEVFYNYAVNDNIQISPVLQVVFDPSNQKSNGTIFTGTLRTVFYF